MPFPWALAFKAIPWTEVIAAAPGVARSAQRLWRQVGGGTHDELLAPDIPLSEQPKELRLAQLEAEVARLDDQLAHQAELIAELAEQNAAMVQALEVLRQRSRLLGYVSGALVVGLIVAFFTLA